MNDKTNELVKQDVLMLDSLAQMQQKQNSFELDQKRKFDSMRLQVEEIKKSQLLEDVIGPLGTNPF